MDYKTLLEKIENYKTKYNVLVLGQTYLNRNIYAVEVLKNKHFSTAFLVAGIHSREHITTDLLCKMLDEKLFDEDLPFNVMLILMLNPDGVELCHGGLSSVPKKYRENLFKMNGLSEDFSLWKANAKGVDLNNNFDANFGTNIHSYIPAPSGFVGEFPESEEESKILANLTRKINPFFTISYHSKGEEIYYNFFQDKKNLKRDKMIATHFSKSTGYIIKNPEKSSSGGYKDFCISKLKIPSLTIEVGNDKLSHPISSFYLEEIFDRHKTIAKDLKFAYNIFTCYKNKL